MVFKVTHHMRVTNDMNLSITFEGIVDTDEEAYRLGYEANGYVDSYLEGYGDSSDGTNKYDEDRTD